MIRILLLLLFPLFEETVDGLDGHRDGADDVQHVEDGDHSAEVRVLRQVIEYDILDQVPVGQIREAAHEKAHGAHDYVRNYRLLEHASRLVLLRIDVKDAHVAFKNAEHLTHEHWQYT